MLFATDSVHPYGTFWLDFADKGIKALALCVAGAWTYISAAKSGLFKPKLETHVCGEIFGKDGLHYILVTCSLKNVGQSKYTIRQKGTGLQAVTLSPAGRETLKGAEVFLDHGWIQPGEQIDEPLVLKIPDPKTFVAVKLSLRVVSDSIAWNASCILREQSGSAITQREAEEDCNGNV
jgi:hypothetical protein